MANFTKKYTLSAKGILSIEDNIVGIENEETGEMFELKDMLSDFADKSIKLTVAYDESFGSCEVAE